MSNVYNDKLLEDCGEALDIAYDLMEAYTSTFVEKELSYAATQLKIAVDANNYEDVANIYLPTLNEKARKYTIELARQSQEHFMTGDNDAW